MSSPPTSASPSSPRGPGRLAFGALAAALALGGLGTLWAQPAPAPRTLPLEALLARCLDAYGGPPALRIQAVRQRGRTTSALRGHGTVERSFVVPDRLRVETSFLGGAGEVRVLAGDRGWRNGEPVAGPGYQAMVLQAARLALPRLLIEGRGQLVDRGVVERGESSLRLLELPLKEGMTLAVEIDEESGRILGSRGSVGALVFETRYSDFRRVGDVWFPFREETSVMGHPGARTELDEITLHDTLPPELFVP
jgi:hypothetical protein